MRIIELNEGVEEFVICPAIYRRPGCLSSLLGPACMN
jgi:hypothetical protein